jgi:hypothetical protein
LTRGRSGAILRESDKSKEMGNELRVGDRLGIRTFDDFLEFKVVRVTPTLAHIQVTNYNWISGVFKVKKELKLEGDRQVAVWYGTTPNVVNTLEPLYLFDKACEVQKRGQATTLALNLGVSIVKEEVRGLSNLDSVDRGNAVLILLQLMEELKLDSKRVKDELNK